MCPTVQVHVYACDGLLTCSTTLAVEHAILCRFVIVRNATVIGACRVDQRGYGVVRSDAELKELMYELYEQEEVRVFVYVFAGALVVRGLV